MSLFRDRWQIVYEVHASDQGRAAAFAQAVTAECKDDLPLIKAARETAQKLFGRVYLVNLKNGEVRQVRSIYDQPAPDENQNLHP